MSIDPGQTGRTDRTWAEQRDAVAAEWERCALDLLASRNPLQWWLAYGAAKIARGVRAQQINTPLAGRHGFAPWIEDAG